MLENFSDFYLPLMKVLDELPSRTGGRSYVIKAIETQYGDQISPSLLEKNGSGRIKWIYNVEMCRVFLIRKDLIDAPATGIWRLTEKGHKWLIEYPNATNLSENRNHVIQSRLPRSSTNLKTYRSPLGKETLTVDKPRYRTLNREIECIRAYLTGHISLQPTDEKLCDWISFCYTFEMYLEGKELFSLVNEGEVNSWYYERTKKIAKVCEQKARMD